jgi:hypothetical protein
VSSAMNNTPTSGKMSTPITTTPTNRVTPQADLPRAERQHCECCCGSL